MTKSSYQGILFTLPMVARKRALAAGWPCSKLSVPDELDQLVFQTTAFITSMSLKHISLTLMPKKVKVEVAKLVSDNGSFIRGLFDLTS